ncbi:MAG: cation-translocating P-type ATPase [Saprospiraceae bacterium]|nr:cation-translocating P-type ATPase [Saprospiraceae bacterium]
MKYYNQAVKQILEELKSSEAGLSKTEANKRLEEYGPNELEEKKKIPAWLLFLKQFYDFMIIILIAAAALSGIMGELTDAIIIFVIIIINAIVGFIQEYKAEKAMEALKKMTTSETLVIRDKIKASITSNDLVPGDIVEIQAGNVVPADLRWFEIHSLTIDESSLTGESVAIDKDIKDISAEGVPTGDQINMGFKGTMVTGGRGKGIVIATGMKTEMGNIAKMLQEKGSQTPLQARMYKFSKNLSYIIFAICIVLFVTGLMRGEEVYTVLLLSVSLAVAAIPEALPTLITIALSRGASRLAKNNALVRKLPAVETWGSVSFICTDKTGTLTVNKMNVVDLYDHLENKQTEKKDAVTSLFHLAMALNNDISLNKNGKPEGESTELALVQKVIDELSLETYKSLRKKYERKEELPFDSDRKAMTTVHHYEDKVLILTKGASESIIETLNDKGEIDKVKQLSDEWAKKGMRVLAYAYQVLDKLPDPFEYENVERDLKLLGLAGLIDPPREEAKVAIQECKTAGIQTVMITGDHPETAQAIAKEIGILEEGDEVITGTEFEKLNDSEYEKKVENITVYARVSPAQKLRIVKTLQKKGNFVSMTGDGVNDAPALKAANIGVAMGINGTDVSKEASHMILLDDNFATIVRAVKEGRRIYDNIRKFIKYILTCNTAEIWVISLAPIFGLPIPLLPIHILWINLVTDGLPALALASEKAEPNIMNKHPRPGNQSLFADGVGIHIIWVGILMAAVTLGVQAWAIYTGHDNWQTMVFTVLAFSQLGHVLGIKSDVISLFRQGIFSNKQLIGAIGITIGLQFAIIYIPYLNEIFKTQPLSWEDLGICLALSLIVFHAVELEKWIKNMIRKK